MMPDGTGRGTPEGSTGAFSSPLHLHEEAPDAPVHASSHEERAADTPVRASDVVDRASVPADSDAVSGGTANPRAHPRADRAEQPKARVERAERAERAASGPPTSLGPGTEWVRCLAIAVLVMCIADLAASLSFAFTSAWNILNTWIWSLSVTYINYHIWIMAFDTDTGACPPVAALSAASESPSSILKRHVRVVAAIGVVVSSVGVCASTPNKVRLDGGAGVTPFAFAGVVQHVWYVGAVQMNTSVC